MNFNKHSELEGLHAFLSPSNYHWIRYDHEKLSRAFKTHLAKMRGTRMHEFAKMAIDLGRKQPKNQDPFNIYVNDAIGFRMKTEQPLFYSFNCFGTADAISFYKNVLRIHDLKTGQSIAANQFDQLQVYAALFCLEYKVNPEEISIELRIYKTDDILMLEPTGEEIRDLMNTIIESDKEVEQLKTGA